MGPRGEPGQQGYMTGPVHGSQKEADWPQEDVDGCCEPCHDGGGAEDDGK